MSVSPKRFEYRGTLERDGRLLADGGAPVELPEAWTPEHLVLAAVAQCTLKSLQFYARGATVSGRVEMFGAVTRRDEDGLFGLVELDLAFDVEVEPAPEPDALVTLLERAERGCFVGNSLRVPRRTSWRVNGVPVTP